jgi:ribulose-phosphate 3-epimerase
MKSYLAPSILSFLLSDVRDLVASLDSAGAPILHLDVMDGQFVPPITFGAEYVKSLRDASSALFEAHLMTKTPERHFEQFAAAGCQRILFHAEATDHADRLAQMIRDLGVSPGIALNPATPVGFALEVGEIVDEVLVMTVNPGWGGQSFLDRCLHKVTRLRTEYPDLLIEVDGGINRETILTARDAGANVFVVGSHLAKAQDLESEVAELMRIVE